MFGKAGSASGMTVMFGRAKMKGEERSEGEGWHDEFVVIIGGEEGLFEEVDDNAASGNLANEGLFM